MSDLISRADAIEAVHKYFVEAFNNEPHEIDEDGDDVFTDMKSVNALLHHNKYVSKALKALPSADRELANLKEEFESADAEQKSDAYKRGFDDCKRAYEIELARSADAVQGEWTHDGSMWENRWVCDKCGHKIFERQTNFCPNCGAKMEGGEK